MLWILAFSRTLRSSSWCSSIASEIPTRHVPYPRQRRFQENPNRPRNPRRILRIRKTQTTPPTQHSQNRTQRIKSTPIQCPHRGRKHVQTLRKTSRDTGTPDPTMRQAPTGTNKAAWRIPCTRRNIIVQRGPLETPNPTNQNTQKSQNQRCLHLTNHNNTKRGDISPSMEN